MQGQGCFPKTLGMEREPPSPTHPSPFSGIICALLKGHLFSSMLYCCPLQMVDQGTVESSGKCHRGRALPQLAPSLPIPAFSFIQGGRDCLANPVLQMGKLRPNTAELGWLFPSPGLGKPEKEQTLTPVHPPPKKVP
jgi:hypothetical protein